MRREDIANLLPAIYESTPGSPLDAVLEVAASLPQPIEDLLAGVDSLFDPRRAPERMLPFLAQWLDLDRFLVAQGEDGQTLVLPAGIGHLRELCAMAAELSRERGTRRGLLRFLEVATGCDGFEIEENVDREGKVRPFHILVNAPEQAQEYEALIHVIVAYEKPAYVTYERQELRFALPK